MKRPLLLWAVSFALGIYCAAAEVVVSSIAFAICAFYIFLSSNSKRNKKIFLVLTACICFSGGFFCMQKDMHRLELTENEIVSTKMSEIILCGQVCGMEKGKAVISSAIICDGISYGKLFKKILVTADDVLDFGLGDKVALKGRFKTFSENTNEGCFNQKKYYLAKGIAAEFCVTEIVERKGTKSPIHLVENNLYELRRSVREVYNGALPKQYAGVIISLVTGEKNPNDREETDLYTDNGIGHILAISGLHVSLLGVGLFNLLRKMKATYITAVPITVIFSLMYLCFAGSPISAERAVFMLVILMISYLFGRAYDMFSAASLICMIMLWMEPFTVLNSSFWLSFSAVAGICVYADERRKHNEKNEKEKRRRKQIGTLMLDAVKFSLCIQMFTLPVTANVFHVIHPFSVLLNLIVLPFVGIILLVGILGGIVGLFSVTLAKYVLFLDNIILVLNHYLFLAFREVPFSSISIGEMSIIRIFIFYIAVAIFFRMRKARIAIALFLVLIVFLPTERGLVVDVLDVGQGDGTYIRTEGGYDIFVDGGSSDNASLGEYVIEPFLRSKGVSDIDCWFVSHTDNDHISGLIWLLQDGYRIEKIFLPCTAKEEDIVIEIKKLAKKNKTDVLFLKAGDVIKLKDAYISILSPKSDSNEADKNANSLVFLYSENGFDGLLTGDIGTESESDVLKGLFEIKGSKYFDDGRIDWYKCAHHGSNYSNSTTFLEEIMPVFCTVSAGRYNNYGHPGKLFLKRINKLGLDMRCTIYSGQIEIGYSRKNGIEVRE
ncbi:MAG: DNA internalization-related competence protein ComEC/Rec2 [Lachnospiraceae bacterium]|nr:DNA internalization-related competence protein ComEC/Rec2 [Lachnospiraceae bacterium]